MKVAVWVYIVTMTILMVVALAAMLRELARA